MPQIDRDKYFNKFHSLTGELSKEYQKTALKVSGDIVKDLEKGVDLQKSLDASWAKHNVSDAMRYKIEDDVVKSAAYGYGILPTGIENLAEVRHQLLVDKWDPSGLTLSQKLHKLDTTMKVAIGDTIRVAFKNKQSMVNTARQLFDGYGYGNKIPDADVPGYLNRLLKANRRGTNSKEFKKAVSRARRNISQIKTPGLKAAYEQLFNTAEDVGSKALEKAIYTATQEKARYFAERIARTEYSRAYGDGIKTRYIADPDIIAIRRKVSSAHKISDICDVLQNSDFYGMGKGVYPKTKTPQYPSHPHCNCRMIEVYAGEALSEKKYNPKAGEKYIKGVAEKKKKEIIGVGTKPAAWEKKLDPFGKGVNKDIKPSIDLKIKPRKEFVPATSTKEVIERLRPFATDKVSMSGLDLPVQNSILKGLEHMMPKYKMKVNEIVSNSRTSSIAFYQRAYTSMDRSKISYDKLSFSKKLMGDKHVVADHHEYINRIKRRAAKNKEILDNAAPAGQARATSQALGKTILPDWRRESLELDSIKLKNIKRWSMSTGDDLIDPDLATTYHEAYHAVHRKNFLEKKFEDSLKRNNVEYQDWFAVSEYAGKKSSELFAELGAAMELDIKVPSKIMKAFKETLKEIK